MEELEKLFREKSDCEKIENIKDGFELQPAISLSEFKETFVKLLLPIVNRRLPTKEELTSECEKSIIRTREGKGKCTER